MSGVAADEYSHSMTPKNVVCNTIGRHQNESRVCCLPEDDGPKSVATSNAKQHEGMHTLQYCEKERIAHFSMEDSSFVRNAKRLVHFVLQTVTRIKGAKGEDKRNEHAQSKRTSVREIIASQAAK